MRRWKEKGGAAELMRVAVLGEGVGVGVGVGVWWAAGGRTRRWHIRRWRRALQRHGVVVGGGEGGGEEEMLREAVVVVVAMAVV
jgi:hypothetical protein